MHQPAIRSCSIALTALLLAGTILSGSAPAAEHRERDTDTLFFGAAVRLSF